LSYGCTEGTECINHLPAPQAIIWQFPIPFEAVDPGGNQVFNAVWKTIATESRDDLQLAGQAK